ncbi:MAG TPA: magnesium protoporphyrin IX methyltransferase [Chloroflexaceae bacterium]|nr:magnesium protoporphyrin IX methyltransferase [Chloroflexaceae bacterium]
MDTAQHKARLRQYFDGVGFERWSAIYGQAALSPIRRSIRVGHSAMLACADGWLADLPPATPLTALDAGCGTGLFSLALARRGFQVLAADLAPQMVAATAGAAHAAGLAERVTCRVADLDELAGRFGLVACFDVLIHYPPAGFAPMLAHLAGLCDGTLLFTYAPHSPLLAALHRAAAIFPKGQRRTEIQMIPDALVRETLAAAGMAVSRTRRVSSGFYHVTLVEARRP